MSKTKIRLKFVDSEPGFVAEQSTIYRVLKKKFDICLCDDPDYIVFYPYGHEHLKYDCVKIFFTGENMVPDFNLCDYAIGFDHLSFGDRYLRVPLWAIRGNFRNFRLSQRPDDAQLLNRKFCSFVVSNWRGDPIRTKFFHELSKYKKVDSGGGYMNNIGGPVKDKMAFVAQYKFNIAFENSGYPGYTTEKIMDPLSVWSVPIYWGDPLVEKDFRSEAIVRIGSAGDVERVIEEIIRLDHDDDAYLRKCKTPCLVHPDLDYYSRQLEDFLYAIFNQSLSGARRTTDCGYQGVFYKKWQREAFAAYERINMPLKVARKMRCWLKV